MAKQTTTKPDNGTSVVLKRLVMPVFNYKVFTSNYTFGEWQVHNPDMIIHQMYPVLLGGIQQDQSDTVKHLEYRDPGIMIIFYRQAEA